MHRTLTIGDPHVTPEALGDCRKLLDLVILISQNGKVDEICFLGDQHHTHGVLSLEVVGFWLWAFDRLEKEAPPNVVCLVGNHDMPGDSSSALNAMMCYRGSRVTVVDRPMVIHGVLYAPYFHDRDAFVGACNRYPECRALICHQTFDGSKYDNGFPAHDGVDLSAIPQVDVLSGHIHTQQELSGDGQKVWYPGSPRWRTASDENVEKGIWVVDRDVDGLIVSKTVHDTSEVCQARYRIKLTPDMPMHLAAEADQAIHYLLEKGHKVAVDIEGPGEWVDKQLAGLPQGLLVRTQRVQKEAPRVRESEGIEVSFRRFLGGFQPLYGTPPARLMQLAKERFSV